MYLWKFIVRLIIGFKWWSIVWLQCLMSLFSSFPIFPIASVPEVDPTLLLSVLRISDAPVRTIILYDSCTSSLQHPCKYHNIDVFLGFQPEWDPSSAATRSDGSPLCSLGTSSPRPFQHCGDHWHLAVLEHHKVPSRSLTLTALLLFLLCHSLGSSHQEIEVLHSE